METYRTWQDMNYTDIHSHLLPGIDDGSSSMAETVELIKMAAEQGIRTIIATPHYSGRSADTEQVRKLTGRVQQEAEKIDKRIRIFPGSETFYEDGCQEAIMENRACTLADSRYVLIEFRPGESYQRIYSGMQNFILEGYYPVIAHMERYQCLWKKKERIISLITLGCYMQVNAGSLMGGIFNSEASYLKKLISEGLIHFIGSDCHNQNDRRPVMEDCLNGLKKKIMDQAMEHIVHVNPNKIIENKFI